MNTNFNTIYYNILAEVVRDGSTEYNSRTKQELLQLDPFSFTIDLSENDLPIPANRQYNPYIGAAECAWMLSGSKSIEWIKKYTCIWDKFSVDGVMETAYGFRWREAFGRDQLAEAIETLRLDPTSRQVVLSAWNPSVDGLRSPMKLNIPCPISLILNIKDGRLNGQVIMRSSDLFVGLPYDVLTYSFILSSLAHELDYPLGSLTFFLAHPHIYAKHLELLDFKQWSSTKCYGLKLPNWKTSSILASKDYYMQTIQSLYDGTEPTTHKVKSRPEVFE